jgi:uncharacterized repeat protein (TIGR01451 family)
VPDLGDKAGSLNSSSENICGNYLFSDQGSQFNIYDAANPMRPKQISTIALPIADDGSVAFSSDCHYLYFGDSATKLNVIDISDILHPAIIFTSSALNSPIKPITVNGNYLYAGGKGLTIFSLSNPAAPSMAGQANQAETSLTYAVSSIAASDNTVLLSHADTSTKAGRYVDVFNTTDKAHPSLVKEVTLNTDEPSNTGKIYTDISDHVAFITSKSSFYQGYLIFTLDFSDPANPNVVDQTRATSQVQACFGSKIKDGKLYISILDPWSLTVKVRVYSILNNRLVYLNALDTNLAGDANFSSTVFVSHYLYSFGFNSGTGDSTFNILDLASDKISIDNSTSSYGSVKSGDTIQYDLIVNNPTSTAVTSPKITDPIPNGTTYLSGTMTVNGGAVADNLVGGAPTWNFPTLAANGQTNSYYIVSFKVKVN